MYRNGALFPFILYYYRIDVPILIPRFGTIGLIYSIYERAAPEKRGIPPFAFATRAREGEGLRAHKIFYAVKNFEVCFSRRKVQHKGGALAPQGFAVLHSGAVQRQRHAARSRSDSQQLRCWGCQANRLDASRTLTRPDVSPGANRPSSSLLGFHEVNLIKKRRV